MNKKKSLFFSSLIAAIVLGLFPTTSSGFSGAMVKMISLKAPQSLKAVAVSQGQIDLSWQDPNTVETGYRVERSLKKEGKFSLLTTLGENQTIYQDASSELKPHTTYYYRVRAYHQKRRFWPKKYSKYSKVASAQTLKVQYSGGYGGGNYIPPSTTPPPAAPPPPASTPPASTPPASTPPPATPPPASSPPSQDPDPSVPPSQPVAFLEDFSSYIPSICLPDSTSFGPWTTIYNGYGCNKITADAANLADLRLDSMPMASSVPEETHATLVLGPTFSGPLTYHVALQTMEQLRTPGPANPWEVGWVVWNYTDDNHFYYFIAKPNGWELGKRDPAYPYNQRFLATGSSPTFPTQSWYTIKITQDADNTINAYVNGILMTTFTDTERPYTNGRIGLYSEDAHVLFDNVSVIQ